MVEIITGKNQRPSRDWLGWVVSSKARTKIKQELDAEERKAAAEGREILARRLKNWKLELPDEALQDLMKNFRYSSEMQFMADISRETVDINDIKSFIVQRQEEKERAAQDSSVHKEQAAAVQSGKVYSGDADDILVINAKNVRGLDYKLSKCCNPVFGDDVFGFVTRTEGIKIHRISCPNAARLLEKYPYRIQKVVWQDSTSSGNFLCTLAVLATMEAPILSRIMDVIGRFKVSMRSFNVKENAKKGLYEISIKLLVPSNSELDKVISQVAAVKGITKVHRI